MTVRTPRIQIRETTPRVDAALSDDVHLAARQRQESAVERKTTIVLLGAANDERLKGRKVVRQFGESGGELAGVFQFGGEKLDGVREARGGQDFLVDAVEDILRRLSILQAFAQDPEEIGLLDVFFTIKNGPMLYPRVTAQPSRCQTPRRFAVGRQRLKDAGKCGLLSRVCAVVHQMHDEREAADAQTVALFRSRLLHYSVVDPRPLRLLRSNTCQPAFRESAGIRRLTSGSGNPQVGIAVAAGEHFWAVEEQCQLAAFDDGTQRCEVGRRVRKARVPNVVPGGYDSMGLP